jgi:hypothetical protein
MELIKIRLVSALHKVLKTKAKAIMISHVPSNSNLKYTQNVLAIPMGNITDINAARAATNRLFVIAKDARYTGIAIAAPQKAENLKTLV